MNFNCLTGDSEGADAFLPWLFERSDEYRRTVMLRYGCGLNAREIAKATGAPLSGVRRDFEDARKTAARYAMDAKKCDRRLRAACGAEMAGYAGAPDWNTLMRAVENRMSEREGQRANAAPVKRAFSWALAMFTLVVLGAMIWMSVVLLDYYRQTRQSAQSAVRVGTQIMAAEDENARA